MQKFVFHASYPNYLNSFSETSISESHTLTQIDKLECQPHRLNCFFSVLSMRPILLSDVYYWFLLSNNSITTHKTVKVISKHYMAPRNYNLLTARL